MLTKFNNSADINTMISDDINSYIKDGYRIDAKESMIDHEKDKNCTFKAVLKKDVDGIECKTVITSTDKNYDDNSKITTYHKVETVGDTKWSERIYTFKSSNDNDVQNVNSKSDNKANDKLNTDHCRRRKCLKLISDKHGFKWRWLNDNNVQNVNNKSDNKSDNNKLNKKENKESNCDKCKKVAENYTKYDSYINELLNKWHKSMYDYLNTFIDRPSFKCLDDYAKLPDKKEDNNVNNKAKSDFNKVTCTKQDPDDYLKDSLIEIINMLF